MPIAPSTNGAPGARSRLVPVAVFLVTALVLLTDLGGQYVWSRDEARDGLVARDMVESGHWLIPHMGGRIYPYKPPLFHWLVALVSRRGVTEWSLRLPSVLAAAGAVTVTFAMGARLAGPLGGLVAAAVLASSATFVEWARAGRLEMLLTLWLTLGLWSALRWLQGGERRHVIILGVALGLGCLTKGPVGLAPLGALVVAITLLRRWSRDVLAALGLALAVGIAFPLAWVALAASAHDGLGEYLGAVLANFKGEMRVFRDRHPLFAAEEIGLGFLPWTLVLPGAAIVLARRWPASGRALVVPLLWAGLLLVTFTAFISPRAVYFLPIYPALALLVAWAWSAGSSRERRWMVVPLMVGVVLMALVGVAVTLWPQTVEVRRAITRMDGSAGIPIALVAGAAALGVAALARRGCTEAVPVLVGAGALLVLVVLQVTVYTPRHNRAYPTREVAARFGAALPTDAEVVYVDMKLTTGLLFYIRRRQVEIYPLRAISDVAGHPRRYALVPQDVAMSLPGQCGWTVPLREETVFLSRYVLIGVNGCTRPGWL